MTVLHQTCAASPEEDFISKLKFLVEKQGACPKAVDYMGNNAVRFLPISE